MYTDEKKKESNTAGKNETLQFTIMHNWPLNRQNRSFVLSVNVTTPKRHRIHHY
jgi:hypothetical protein